MKDGFETTANTSSTRGAADYRMAVNAVIDILEQADKVVPKDGKLAAIVRAAKTVAPYARQVLEIAPAIAPAAEQAVAVIREKAPDAVNDAADKVVSVAKGAGGAVAERGKAMSNAVHDAFESRAQAKARVEARRALLDGAGNKLEVKDFEKTWEMQRNLSQGDDSDNVFACCGCYAIASYPTTVKKGNYHKFQGIYVGKSRDIFQSIHDDVIGKGSVDVYADVKYKQHVYVFMYPCVEDKLEELEASLIAALDADESYNAKR